MAKKRGINKDFVDLVEKYLIGQTYKFSSLNKYAEFEEKRQSILYEKGTKEATPPPKPKKKATKKAASMDLAAEKIQTFLDQNPDAFTDRGRWGETVSWREDIANLCSLVLERQIKVARITQEETGWSNKLTHWIGEGEVIPEGLDVEWVNHAVAMQLDHTNINDPDNVLVLIEENMNGEVQLLDSSFCETSNPDNETHQYRPATRDEISKFIGQMAMGTSSFKRYFSFLSVVLDTFKD